MSSSKLNTVETYRRCKNLDFKQHLLTGIFYFNFLLFLVAQPSSVNRKTKPYNFIFTLGYSCVNDNEEKFANVFGAPNSWNFAPYPSLLSVNKYLRRGFSQQCFLSLTPYRPGTIVNDVVSTGGFLAAMDYAFRIDPNRFSRKDERRISPFIGVGAGLTFRKTNSFSLTPTLNLNLGLNIWFTGSFGLELLGTGKLAIAPNIYVTRNDYLQFSAGLSYRTFPQRKNTGNKKRRHKWINERHRYRTNDRR